MKHITDEQLSARLDGARSGPQDDAAARHLGACEACRGRLAAMAALDADLGRVLEHDPGEAYFASFATRVSERIAREGAPAREPAAAAPVRRLKAWWNSPRALAWAGSTAALVVVAALGVILARDSGTRSGADRALDRAVVGQPPAGGDQPPHAAQAPAPLASAPTDAPAQKARAAEARADDKMAQAPVTIAESHADVRDARDEVAAKERGGIVAPQRAMEVKTLPNGEQVVVQSGTPMPAAPLRTVRTPSGFTKPGATPMGNLGEPTREAAAPLALGGARRASADEDAARQVCGVVRDARGRAIAGAVLSVAETGASATADGSGAFCLAAGGAGTTLEAFAVGYRVYRATVPADASAGEVTVTLLPVETLPGSAGAGRFATPPRANALAAPRSASPDATTLSARTATAAAQRGRTVVLWLQAADAWSQVTARATTPEAALDGRFHLAEARLGAWRLGRTEAERAAARAAVDDYLASAHAADLRTLAEGWARELAP